MELNKIYNENNLLTMGRMSDDMIDLVVTSPPYDNLRAYNGFQFPFEQIAQELYRVVKNGGVLVWVVGDSTINGSESGTSFKQALYFKEIGFRLHDTMIYAKANFIPLNHNRYEQQFEYMFVFSKGSPKNFNPIKIPCKTAGNSSNLQRKGYGFRNGSFRRRNQDVVVSNERVAGNIFEYPTGASGMDHPAVFPEQLAADHIQTWSMEADLIYDPFGGSGTVAKMAHMLNRKWVLSEISEEYCAVAQKRIDPLINQLQIFP